MESASWVSTAITIILSIFGGGSLTMFVQFLINRHDSRKGELKQLREAVRSLRDEFRESQATEARVRILRFSDEMLHNYRHSKESFDQVLQDIDHYTKYCEEHPHYENERAKSAISHIRRVYQDCLDNGSFL